MSDLTARQVDVLTLIAQGRTAGQIADELNYRLALIPKEDA